MLYRFAMICHDLPIFLKIIHFFTLAAGGGDTATAAANEQHYGGTFRHFSTEARAHVGDHEGI